MAGIAATGPQSQCTEWKLHLVENDQEIGQVANTMASHEPLHRPAAVIHEGARGGEEDVLAPDRDRDNVGLTLARRFGSVVPARELSHDFCPNIMSRSAEFIARIPESHHQFRQRVRKNPSVFQDWRWPFRSAQGLGSSPD